MKRFVGTYNPYLNIIIYDKLFAYQNYDILNQ